MYFIGIVPSEEIYIELSNIQEQYMNKIGVEPHVTLKAPSQLNESQECLKQIEDIISETKQFYITPKTIEFFGEQVLYLSLYSPELIKLHNQLVD
ncbi:2'-5' RNA ligase family protein, partial [Mammaliicoccus fleurettii]|nr:2'-5' RNA ligase family protein [Mammaliicoccus fleurettii]